MRVKFIGLQGVPLGGRFIYPGEVREVTEDQLAAAEKAHPGWFVVEGDEGRHAEMPQQEPEQPSPFEQQTFVTEEEVSNVHTERIDATPAKRRTSPKRHPQ
jgi:hypothetical protein